MPLLRTILSWPWHWLLETSTVPGQVQVNPSVQPSLDVGQHNAGQQIFREAFAMAAGTNTIVLPGLSRAAALNPAAAPVPTSRGARRWLGLAIASSASLAAGDDIQLTYRLNTLEHAVAFVQGNGAWVGPVPIPLIRGTHLRAPTGPAQHGAEHSVYVPDPAILFLSILSQAGTETVTVSGVFVESDSVNSPIPDMWR